MSEAYCKNCSHGAHYHSRKDVPERFLEICKCGECTQCYNEAPQGLIGPSGDFTLAQALLDWGTRNDLYQIRIHGDADIVIWFDRFCNDAPEYRALHVGILERDEVPLVTWYPSSNNRKLRKVRPPMASERLEVLLVELTRLYLDLWTRDDWYVTKRYSHDRA
jgi:hypothetical protein